VLRWVLVFAVVALVLGAGAVVFLEFDQALARNGRGGHVPQQSWTVAPWCVVVFGFVAVSLWVAERRRSHARVTVGVVIAVVAVVATPIAVAIAQPDDTAMTVVAFGMSNGRQRWQSDIDLVSTATPIRSDGRNRLIVDGFSPSGRCKTRPERYVLDRRDGKTLSRTTTAELPPQSGPIRGAPVTAAGIRFDIAVSTEPDVRATLRASDIAGQVLWSRPADAKQPLSVLYADADVVAIYMPGTRADEPVSEIGPAAAAFDTVVGVLDARTGRPRWGIRAGALPLGSPQFSHDAMFAIEGGRVVVHATATGATLARHQLQLPNDGDAQLLATKRHDTVALIEGRARRLTLFDPTGTIRWRATLPRTMPSAQLTALDDTIYLAGGGNLGYSCGGD
jgi:outer membrane protein assembly factor BamB